MLCMHALLEGLGHPGGRKVEDHRLSCCTRCSVNFQVKPSTLMLAWPGPVTQVSQQSMMMDLRPRHSEEERAGPERSMDSVGSSHDHEGSVRNVRHWRRSSNSSRSREVANSSNAAADLHQHSFSSVASVASTNSLPSADGRNHSGLAANGGHPCLCLHVWRPVPAETGTLLGAQ